VKRFCQIVLLVSVMLTQVALAADKLSVVASFSILGDIVAQVGGDRVSVSTLVGPDQDAHVFQRRRIISRPWRAPGWWWSMVWGLKAWMDRLVQSAGYRGDIVVASNGIAVRERDDEHAGHDDHAHDDHAHQHGKNDPHAWQNPLNVVVYVRNITAALSKTDPSGAAIYKKNGDAYIAQLNELDRWAAAQFASIPDARRKVITSHDAFEYFGAHYKVRFLAPQGVSTDSEPSARDVAQLIRQIKQEKIRAVFIENMSNPKLMQQISKEAGATLGGKLYADALSKADGPAPTYLLLMRYNIGQLLAQLKKQ